MGCSPRDSKESGTTEHACRLIRVGTRFYLTAPRASCSTWDLSYFQQIFNFSLCYHKTAVNLKLTFIFRISFSFSLGSTVTFFLFWSSSALLRALGQDIMRYLCISVEELCLLSFAGVMDWHCRNVCSVTSKRTNFWVGGEAVYWHSFNYITYSSTAFVCTKHNSHQYD